MGCASSKSNHKRCKHCHEPYSPVPRSYSMHVVHPPQQKGDSYHVVALTSSTLGSLKLDSSKENGHVDVTTKDNLQWSKSNGNIGNEVAAVDDDDDDDDDDELAELKKKEDFSMGLIEAKRWSNMIQEKIPKAVPRTPTMTPPGEPETINTWELMAGLEEFSPCYLNNHRFRSFSFDVSRHPSPVPECPKLHPQQNGTLSSPSPNNNKPFWLHLADDEADPKCPEFDPEVISTFRKSLEELSPNHPFHLKPMSDNDQKQQQPPNAGTDFSALETNDVSKVNGVIKAYKRGGSKKKVVVYFTSLRGVRKTYEDCCHVRVILKGLGVRVDERDVSMHSGFKEELKELLGEGFSGGGLPGVFVGRKYIGGAEEIRRMHEDGQLEKALEGCEMVDDDGGGGGGGGTCEACGDIRFVPCETCSGSCKIYYEREDDDDDDEDDEEQEELEEEEGVEYGFQRCPDCNENGLIRCPICCD